MATSISDWHFIMKATKPKAKSIYRKHWKSILPGNLLFSRIWIYFENAGNRVE